MTGKVKVVVIIIGVLTIGLGMLPVLMLLSFFEAWLEDPVRQGERAAARAEKRDQRENGSRGRGLFIRH